MVVPSFACFDGDSGLDLGFAPGARRRNCLRPAFGPEVDADADDCMPAWRHARRALLAARMLLSYARDTPRCCSRPLLSSIVLFCTHVDGTSYCDRVNVRDTSNTNILVLVIKDKQREHTQNTWSMKLISESLWASSQPLHIEYCTMDYVRIYLPLRKPALLICIIVHVFCLTYSSLFCQQLIVMHTASVVLTTAAFVMGVLLVLTYGDPVAAGARGFGLLAVELVFELVRGDRWVFERGGEPVCCFGSSVLSVLLVLPIRVPGLEVPVDVEFDTVPLPLVVSAGSTIGGIGRSRSSATSGAHSPVAVRRSRCRLSYARKQVTSCRAALNNLQVN